MENGKSLSSSIVFKKWLRNVDEKIRSYEAIVWEPRKTRVSKERHGFKIESANEDQAKDTVQSDRTMWPRSRKGSTRKQTP